LWEVASVWGAIGGIGASGLRFRSSPRIRFCAGEVDLGDKGGPFCLSRLFGMSAGWRGRPALVGSVIDS